MQKWIDLHSFVSFLIGVAVLTFIITQYNSVTGGRQLGIILVSIFFYIPATLLVVFVIRVSINLVKKKSSLSGIFAIFTGFILLIVAVTIAEEITKDSDLGSIIPQITILVMLIVFPILSFYTFFLNGSTKDYMKSR